MNVQSEAVSEALSLDLMLLDAVTAGGPHRV